MGIVQKFAVEEAQQLAVRAGGIVDPAQRGPSKLLGLELLRFASALAVLFYHFNHFAKIPGATPIARAELPLYQWFWPLYDYGQFGVDLFWGISGYIFFWKYGQAIHTGAVSAARFFWLRFSRLYPLHFATLILVAALQVIHRQLTGEDYVFPANSLGEFARHLFLATDWGTQRSLTFNGPIWSVSAEVAVYAGFFLLLRRLAPSFLLCFSIVLVGTVLQLSGFNSVPANCAVLFFAGGTAALVESPRRTMRVAAAAIAATIVVGAGSAGVLRNLDNVPYVILCALPFFLVALAGEFPGLTRHHRRIQAAGNLTYSTYLLHFPLQLTLAIAVASSGFMPDPTRPVFLLFYLAIVMGTGALSYRALELPAQNWVRRHVLKARAAA